MRRSSKLLAALFTIASAGAAFAAERVPPSVIAKPQDMRPNAITRPSSEPERKWRKGRRSPEIVSTPQGVSPPPARFEAPRYDGRGRRLNVPGRPDTYDQIGRSRALQRPAAPNPQMGPTVRTDAPTRINQFPPPSSRRF